MTYHILLYYEQSKLQEPGEMKIIFKLTLAFLLGGFLEPFSLQSPSMERDSSQEEANSI